MRALLKYHFVKYKKSYKFIIPSLAVVIYLPVAYSMFPQNVLSSFAISTAVIFYLMIWLGFGYSEVEESVSEQLIILKLRNNQNLYYASKVLFINLFGMGLSMMMILYPIIINTIYKNHLFQRAISIQEVLWGLFVHFAATVLGVMLGMLFHPRIIADRKKALMIVALLAIMSVVKGAIAAEYPVFHLVSWVLPPLFEIIDVFYDEKIYVNTSIVLPTLTYILLYIAVEIGIYVRIMKRALF